MKKRILVISWFFPPINSSEGLVTYKLLNNSKLQYDVYTQNSNNSWAYKMSGDIKINNNINRIYSDTNSIDEFRLTALDFFEKNKDKYDIVMTRSMPEVDHEIGLEIKKIKSDIIWIASFGDPIAYNPFTIKSLNLKNPYSLDNRYERPMGFREILSPKRFLKSKLYNHRIRKVKEQFIDKNIKFQKDILNTCDYVIYNSINQKDYMISSYENKEELDKKSIILPHSFDSKLYHNFDNKNDKIVFTYIGHLDVIRTPILLFHAIKELNELYPNLADLVEFNFYGNLSDQDKLYLINNYLLDIVHIKKNVTYLESLDIMSKSDWLLHVDANISDIVSSNIFFAAKLADYLGTRKKIMGITMLDGVSADILRKNNALVMSHSKDEIKNYLYLILFENFNIVMDDMAFKEFDAVNVAKSFDDFIQNIK